MGAGSSSEGGGDPVEGENMMPSGSAVSGALSSLWSTSSDKDDTCVQWGLVRYSLVGLIVVVVAIVCIFLYL